MPIFTTQARIDERQLTQKFEQQKALQEQLFKQQQALQDDAQAGDLTLEQTRQQGRASLQEDEQAFRQPMQEAQRGLIGEQTALTRAQTAMTRANTMAAPLQMAAEATKLANAAVLQYGDDIRKSMEPVREVLTARQQVTGLLATGTALGGTAAVIKLAKALDPTSSVREGEVGTIEGGQGLTLQIQNAWNRLGGEGMDQRAMEAFQQVVDEVTAPVALRASQMVAGYQQDMTAAGIGNRFDAVLQTSGVDPGELAWLSIPAMTDEQLKMLAEDGQ